MMNSTTVIKGRGRGKRLKLMKCDESDNKSTAQESIHHLTDPIIVKSSGKYFFTVIFIYLKFNML